MSGASRGHQDLGPSGGVGCQGCIGALAGCVSTQASRGIGGIRGS